MSYSNLKQEIEIAKELPVVEIKQDEVVNQKIEFMQLEIEKLEKKIENIEDKVYKR